MTCLHSRVAGWQLGEHGEWTKHTNFDLSTRIPMMVHVPGVTAEPAPRGKTFPFRDALAKNLVFRPEEPRVSVRAASSDALVEAVDLYATISELAGLAVPPLCPKDSFHVAFCTEGVSLVPLIKNLTMTSSQNDVTVAGRRQAWKRAVFSQYPRPKLVPTDQNDSKEHIRVMGYTMRTDEYRYTEWVAYDLPNFKADWSTVYARELYVYSSDPHEDVNVAEVAAFQDLGQALSRQLRAGWRKALPTPGAWW